VKTKA